MDGKAKATYILLIDYLTQMERTHLISSKELETAKKLAAMQYGVEDVCQ